MAGVQQSVELAAPPTGNDINPNVQRCGDFPNQRQ
jgi:hypothetical protein